MRQLHLVALSDDRTGLIFAGDGDPAGDRFLVPIDPTLLEVLDGSRDLRQRAAATSAGSPPAGVSGREAARQVDAVGDEARREEVPTRAMSLEGVATRGAATGTAASTTAATATATAATTTATTRGAATTGATAKAAAGGGDRPAVRPRRPALHGRGRWSAATLTPREIQARLRDGRTVADVATEAEIDEEWIERFAPPIRAEQHAAVTRVGVMVYQTSRRGPSARPLAESVRRNLMEKGLRFVEEEWTSCWTAFRHDGREWVVRFTYRLRGREVQADWLTDLRAGSLVALNRPAAILGYVAPEAVAEAPEIDLRPSAVPPPAPDATSDRRAGAEQDQPELQAPGAPPLF